MPALFTLATMKLLGGAGVFSYAVARAAQVSGLYRYHRFAVVAVPVERMPPMPAGFAVSRLSEAQLAKHQTGASAAANADRAGQGMICLGAHDRRGRLTGVMWVARHRASDADAGIDFIIPQACCWDEGLWIDPRYRLGRTFPALWAGVADWMRDQGLTHSLSWIADYNIASLMAHRRLSAVACGYHHIVRIGGWCRASFAQGGWRRDQTDAAVPFDLADVFRPDPATDLSFPLGHAH